MPSFSLGCLLQALCMLPANDSRRCNVKTSLIGWVNTYTDSCFWYSSCSLSIKTVNRYNVYTDCSIIRYNVTTSSYQIQCYNIRDKLSTNADIVWCQEMLSWCDETRDDSGYGLSQWETTFQCNVVSPWQSPYLELSLETVSLASSHQTHCGQNNMADILHMKLSNAVFQTKMVVLTVFLSFQLARSYHWIKQMAWCPMAPSHNLIQNWPSSMIHTCIPGLNVLTQFTGPGKGEFCF